MIATFWQGQSKHQTHILRAKGTLLIFMPFYENPVAGRGRCWNELKKVQVEYVKQKMQPGLASKCVKRASLLLSNLKCYDVRTYEES